MPALTSCNCTVGTKSGWNTVLQSNPHIHAHASTQLHPLGVKGCAIPQLILLQQCFPAIPVIKSLR